MTRKRDTYKYYVKVGRKIVFRGITDNLIRRRAIHKVYWEDCRIVQVDEKTTYKQAFKWLKRQPWEWRLEEA